MYIPEEDEDTKLDDIDVEETETDEEDVDTDEEDEDGNEDDEDSEDESDDEDEPGDLADAFSRLRNMDAEDAEGDVEGGDGAEADDEDETDDADAENDLAADDGRYDADGGSAVYPDATQYQASQQAIVDQLNRQAVAQARQQFQKDGIREFTMDDVYERTQDGRVIYHNPDDPNRPFSSRMEAQQWIDSFNKQVQTALIQTATQIRDKNAKAAMPALRLLQFAPVYDVMDPAIREVFDDLISDYEVKNRAGKVVGYSCDLEKMAMKASRLAKKYNNSPRKRSTNAKIGKQKVRKYPALDAKSRGSSRSAKTDEEPQTMEEAMKRLNEINRRKR